MIADQINAEPAEPDADKITIIIKDRGCELGFKVTRQEFDAHLDVPAYTKVNAFLRNCMTSIDFAVANPNHPAVTGKRQVKPLV